MSELIVPVAVVVLAVALVLAALGLLVWDCWDGRASRCGWVVEVTDRASQEHVWRSTPCSYRQARRVWRRRWDAVDPGHQVVHPPRRLAGPSARLASPRSGAHR